MVNFRCVTALLLAVSPMAGGVALGAGPAVWVVREKAAGAYELRIGHDAHALSDSTVNNLKQTVASKHAADTALVLTAAGDAQWRHIAPAVKLAQATGLKQVTLAAGDGAAVIELPRANEPPTRPFVIELAAAAAAPGYRINVRESPTAPQSIDDLTNILGAMIQLRILDPDNRPVLLDASADAPWTHVVAALAAAQRARAKHIRLHVEPAAAGNANPNTTTATDTGPDTKPNTTTHTTPPVVENANIDMAAVDWLREHNAFGPTHPIVEDGRKQIEPQLRKSKDFLYWFGAKLLKSGKPTVLAVHRGQVYALPLTAEQAKAAGLSAGRAIFVPQPDSQGVMGPRAFYELDELRVTDPGSTNPGSALAGAVTIKPSGFTPFGTPQLHVTYLLPKQRVRAWVQVAATPVRQRLGFEFKFSHPEPKATEPIAAVVFLEVGGVDANDNFAPQSKPAAAVVVLQPPKG